MFWIGSVQVRETIPKHFRWRETTTFGFGTLRLTDYRSRISSCHHSCIYSDFSLQHPRSVPTFRARQVIFFNCVARSRRDAWLAKRLTPMCPGHPICQREATNILLVTLTSCGKTHFALLSWTSLSPPFTKIFRLLSCRNASSEIVLQ